MYRKPEIFHNCNEKTKISKPNNKRLNIISIWFSSTSYVSEGAPCLLSKIEGMNDCFFDEK
jgi:hypothetical protein